MDLSEPPRPEGPARLRKRHAPVAVFALAPAFTLTFEPVLASPDAPLMTPRRVFTERLSSVAAPYARRTRGLTEVVRLPAFALGGEPGARIVERLVMNEPYR